MSKIFRESALDLDDTHSFVLRISFNRPRGRGGKAIPHFQLEHVNQQSRIHFRSVEEVCVHLTSQVEAMLANLNDMEGRTS